MAGNGVRRGLIALVLLVAVVGAGAVLVGGALLQDEGDADGAPDDTAVSQENRTVDADRVNMTVRLEPNDEMEMEELQYELVVIGEIEAANDAANGTVDCTGELCVVDGTLPADAADEELPRYELRGVVTSASPASGYTANVTGTLEGDAIEGLGLGAYNVTDTNETSATNDSVIAALGPSSEGTADGGESSTVHDEASGSGEAIEGEETNDGETNGADAASASGDDEMNGDDAASASGDDEATGDDEASGAEPLQTDGGTPEEDTNDADASENAESGGESPSVTFDGCSTATVEGDAYAYEAGLRYYVSDGLDTSTIDESELSTPTTIEGNELIGDARTTDVVVESVLVLDEDFGVVTQASNPNYEDCVDEIEQQHANWEAEQGDA